MSVLMWPPRNALARESLRRPLLADPATREVVVGGAVADASGEVVLFLDSDVLATSTLASGHALHHKAGPGVLAVGYAPVRVLHERAPSDFGTRLRAAQYEDRCARYDRDPDSLPADLWAGSFSLRREDCVALGIGSAEAAQADVGARAAAAGLRGVFDRSLRALRIYQPTLAELARDARAEGAERARRGALTEPGGGAAEAAILRAFVLAAGSAHVWRVQDAAARRLWEAEARRGAAGANPSI